jgi:hypothetical protein
MHVAASASKYNMHANFIMQPAASHSVDGAAAPCQHHSTGMAQLSLCSGCDYCMALQHAYSAGLQAGNFHMAFDTSLGLPWDPHSTANYWRTFKSYQFSFTNMANASLTEGFTIKHPMSQAAFYEQIGKVLVTTDMGERQRLWTMILEAQHEQAVAAPLSYLVNVAVVSDRFENFVFGQQKYDMQLHKLVDKQLVGSRPGGAAALSTGAVAGIVVAVVVAVIAVGVIALLVVRERRGRPVFAPYVPMDEGLPNGQVGQAGTTANGKDVQMGHV